MIMKEWSKYLLETLNLVLYFPVQQLKSHLAAACLSGKSSERSKQRKARGMASRTTRCQAGICGLLLEIVLEF